MARKYVIFRDRKVRENFKKGLKAISEYLRKNRIKRVLLVDRAGRPLWIALKTLNPKLEIKFVSPRRVVSWLEGSDKSTDPELVKFVKGKRIAVVDDYLASGTTLRNLAVWLTKVGAKEQHLIALGSYFDPAQPHPIPEKIKSLNKMENIKLFIGLKEVHDRAIFPIYSLPNTNEYIGIKEIKEKTIGIPTHRSRRLREEIKTLAKQVLAEMKKERRGGK